MKEFIWKIAGADIQILKQSGVESQKSFLTVGGYYILVNLIVFWAFYGLFWGVFGSPFVGFFAGFLLTFLIGNIYRLNMMSLDPPSLPVEKSDGSVMAAVVLRYLIILLFAIFVAKAFETSLLGHLVDSVLHEDIIRSGKVINLYDESQMFVAHGVLLNKTYPAVWIITIVIAFIFIYPIYLKRKLFKNNEYFRLRYRIYAQLVEENYAKAMDELDSVHVKTYLQYSALKRDKLIGKFIPNDFLLKRYSIQESKYQDPPFNTRKVRKENDLKSHDDFISLDWK